MPRLPDSEIARCEECGKLFEALAGVTLCSQCRHALKSEDEVLHEAVERLAREISLQQAMNTEESLLDPPPPPKCVRCARYPQLDQSEFCLSCQLELVNDLGNAAYELFENVRLAPKKPKYTSLRDVLGEKRSRTAISHIQLVTAPKLK